MRMGRLALGSLILLAVPTVAFVKSCGFSARIDVVQSFYDHAEFVGAQRCGVPQSSVDLVYVVLNGEGKLMTKDDPLFAMQGANAIVLETPEPFTIAGQGRSVDVTVSGNTYVEITKPGRARGVALLMDN